MTFIRKKLDWIDLSNPDLWVTFLLKRWFEDDYDTIVEFEETDDMYRCKVYDWYNIPKDTVEKYRFHEIGIECRQCNWYCRLSEKVKGCWIYYKWTPQEFERTWDFCCEECLNKYVNNPENEFTLK